MRENYVIFPLNYVVPDPEVPVFAGVARQGRSRQVGGKKSRRQQPDGLPMILNCGVCREVKDVHGIQEAAPIAV